MPPFTHPFAIANLNGDRFQTIDALVNTGATYSSIPANILQDLGVEPTATVEFELTDGTTTERQLGEARAKIADKEIRTPVIFAPDTAPTLLGAYTLERAHLTIDPHAQQIIPTRPRL